MIAGLAIVAVLGIAAPFVLYPFLLFAHAWLARKPIASADHVPQVDLIICAHDEARSIRAKLENALRLDYPEDRLKIWLASDGSTDATVEIARSFQDRRVSVLDLPRKGKAHALASAAQSASGDVLAFSDANSEWQPSALRALMRPFADDEVGGVAGNQCYSKSTNTIDHDDTMGERGYWDFDRVLKRWQSQAGSTISATGAIYAIRRDLFQPPPADATDDFMISTGVIAQGKRLVFAEDAIAVEPPAGGQRGEFDRKVRITTRGLRAVAYRRGLLNPTVTGLYALELLIHKIWRRLIWIPLLILVIATPLLWSAGGALAVVGVSTIGCVAGGLLGLLLPGLRRVKPIALASYVLMVNAACAVATVNTLRGHSISVWDPARAHERASGRAS